MIDNSTFGTLKAMFHTFGCKLNFAETSTVARTFAHEGIRRVTAGEKPDIIVVNTCSVTELADKNADRQSVPSTGAIPRRQSWSQAAMHSSSQAKWPVSRVWP